MASTIQLGNFFTTGGKQVLGGSGGSGIDTKTLIEGLVAARQIPVKALEDKITLNDKRNTTFGEFRSLLSALKDSADLLRKVPGFSKESGNAFDFADTAVFSNTTVEGSSYVSITAAAGTPAQSYTINEVTSLAAAKIQTSNTFSVATADAQAVFATPGANQLGDGTITFTRNATPITVTLDDGDTLNEVASKFNAISGTTGVRATVVKIADGSFKLQFSATDTGTANDFSMTPGGGNVTDPDGAFANVTFSTTQLADDAVFQINGQSITRSSNSIDDVITGLTFNLKQATPDGTTLTAQITPDTKTAHNAIINFMNAYNDIKIFAAKQSQLKGDGTYADDAVLANNSTLRATVNTIGSELSRVVSGLSSSTLRRLSDVGITFTDLQESKDNPFVRNILTLDDSKLNSALDGNFDEVRKIFEFTFTSSNTNLNVFTRTNALAVNDFTLTITPGSSLYQAAYTDDSGSHTINLDATAFVGGGGYTLKGQAGTALEGLTLLYGTASSGTAVVNISQGIGDRLFNLADEMLKSDTGSVAVEQNALKTANEKTQEDIDRLNTQIEVYRTQLLQKFSALEQALSRANTLLQALQAQDAARNNS